MPEDVSLPVLTPDGSPWDKQPKWRRDFPIDVSEDNYVARRDFTKFMVLTSFAFVVGQWWIAARNTLLRRSRPVKPKRIVAIDDVSVGTAVAFNYPGPHDGCILTRTSEDTFVAYSGKCTHLSCAVLPDVGAGLLRCPCHNGAFELATGRPLAGPPRRPLPRIKLELRDGHIFALGVEERTS